MIKMPFRRLFLVSLLAIFALGSGGCARIGYNNLDHILLWSIDDVVDLRSGQRAALKHELQAFHDWHRASELPRAAVLLEQLAAELEAPIAPERVEYYAASTLGLFRATLTDLAPRAARVLSGLSDEQVEELLDTLRDEPDKEKPEKSAAEAAADRAEDRAEFMEGILRRLTRKLSDAQRARIRAWSDGLEDTSALSATERRRWHAGLEAALLERHDVAVLEAALMPLFTDPRSLFSEEYKEKARRNHAATLRLLADLSETVSSKQRARAQSRLRKLAEDFRHLSGT